MIIFVGEGPSKQNLSPYTAFVGTKSYKRLLEWIWMLNISINDVSICNIKDINKYTNAFLVTTPQISFDIIENKDKVIALGAKVEKELNKMGLRNYRIDHPSGLNRNINDKIYVKSMLKDCKKWIGEKHV